MLKTNEGKKRDHERDGDRQEVRKLKE